MHLLKQNQYANKNYVNHAVVVNIMLMLTNGHGKCQPIIQYRLDQSSLPMGFSAKRL